MNIFILFLSCLTCFYLPDLSAKTMHLFILGDTAETTTGFAAMRKNIINVKESFSYIAKIGQLDFAPPEELTTKEPKESDKHLTRKKILHAIRKKSISPDDIVILYFAGHGGREQENRTFLPFGNFINEKRNDGIKRVDFSDITKHLLSKNASLYLILTDCCNVLVSKDLSFGNSARPTFELEKFKILTNANAISQLFQKRGLIVASATSPTEFGWCNNTQNDTPSLGSVFTKFLLNHLFSELQTSNPSWENVLKKTQIACSEETKKENYKPSKNDMDLFKPPHTFQTPRYETIFFDKKRSSDTFKKAFLKACRYKYKAPDQTMATVDEDTEFEAYVKKVCTGITPDYLILSTPEK